MIHFWADDASKPRCTLQLNYDTKVRQHIFWVQFQQWNVKQYDVNVCVCVLAVYNKAQAQRISNREFKLWTFLQDTESRVATFHAETCVMSHQSLSRQAKSKYESPTAVESGCKTPKSDNGSSENV